MNGRQRRSVRYPVQRLAKMGGAVKLGKGDPSQFAGAFGHTDAFFPEFRRCRMLVHQPEEDIAVFDVGGGMFDKKADLLRLAGKSVIFDKLKFTNSSIFSLLIFSTSIFIISKIE